MSSLLSQVGVILVILIIALAVLCICQPFQMKQSDRNRETGNRRPFGGFAMQNTATRILPQFTVEWSDGRRKHSAPLYGKEGGFFIGRQDADIVLASDYVSSPHARVEEDSEGQLWLEDLDSLNGTKLRGQRIRRIQVTEGLVLTLGDVELCFRLAGGGGSFSSHGGAGTDSSMTRRFRR